MAECHLLPWNRLCWHGCILMESAALAPCTALGAGCALGYTLPCPRATRQAAGQGGGSPGWHVQHWYGGTRTGELCHGPRAQDVTCRGCGSAVQGIHTVCARLVGCAPPCAHCVPVCVGCTHRGVCIYIHMCAHASGDYDEHPVVMQKALALQMSNAARCLLRYFCWCQK